MSLGPQGLDVVDVLFDGVGVGAEVGGAGKPPAPPELELELD